MSTTVSLTIFTGHVHTVVKTWELSGTLSWHFKSVQFDIQALDGQNAAESAAEIRRAKIALTSLRYSKDAPVDTMWQKENNKAGVFLMELEAFCNHHTLCTIRVD